MSGDDYAKLVERMIDRAPWKDQMWARAALAVAARAIRRGRHLTDHEKLLNLAKAMEEPDSDGEAFPDVAAMPSSRNSRQSSSLRQPDADDETGR